MSFRIYGAFACTLQWGRGCYAAETSVKDMVKEVEAEDASMGPRLLRRGDVEAARAEAAARDGFNGAAAVTPRRRHARTRS